MLWDLGVSSLRSFGFREASGREGGNVTEYDNCHIEPSISGLVIEGRDPIIGFPSATAITTEFFKILEERGGQLVGFCRDCNPRGSK